jgi:hypothetical protein
MCLAWNVVKSFQRVMERAMFQLCIKSFRSLSDIINRLRTGKRLNTFGFALQNITSTKKDNEEYVEGNSEVDMERAQHDLLTPLSIAIQNISSLSPVHVPFIFFTNKFQMYHNKIIHISIMY